MEDGPPFFDHGFSCRGLLFVNTMPSLYVYGAITLYGWLSHAILLNHRTYVNWAISLSLATTRKISVDFFSYGYLDVSVPQVRFEHLCIQCSMTLKKSRVAPFGDLRLSLFTS